MEANSRNRGFSLIEVLVVIGIVVMLGGIGLLVSMDTFRGTNYRSDRDLLIVLLQRARAESINNLCAGTCADGMEHGVHIDTTNNKYVLFQGSSYSSSDPENSSFDADVSTVRTGATDVVFDQLTGRTTASTITLTATGKTSVITISTEGQITWTN